MNATPLDFAKAREAMVEQQVRPWDVLDTRVLEVLSALPRETFVPEALRSLAYADLALPLAHGQQMLKPVVEGRLLQALALKPGDSVLEIGTGSGYLTACLGRLAREVVSIELHADLAEAASARLAALGFDDNIRVETADALQVRTERRFDAVCIGGAVDTIPPHFLEWLAPNGRMVVVEGRAPAMAAVLVRNPVNARRIESLFETDLPYLVGAEPKPEFHF